MIQIDNRIQGENIMNNQWTNVTDALPEDTDPSASLKTYLVKVWACNGYIETQAHRFMGHGENNHSWIFAEILPPQYRWAAAELSHKNIFEWKEYITEVTTPKQEPNDDWTPIRNGNPPEIGKYWVTVNVDQEKAVRLAMYFTDFWYSSFGNDWKRDFWLEDNITAYTKAVEPKPYSPIT